MNPKQFQSGIKAALSLHAAGRASEAAKRLGQLLDAAPLQPAILNEVGMLAIRLGYLDTGISWLGRSLVVDAAQPTIWAVRGMGLNRLERRQEALESLNRAIELRPDYADAYFDRGYTHRGLRRFPEALADFDRALSLDPRNAATHTNRGAVLLEMDRLDESLESCRRAVAIQSDYVLGHFNLGAVLEALGRRPEAIRSYERAIAVDPQHVGANWNRALLQLMNGNFEEGWRGYEWRWLGPQKADSWLRDSPLLWRGDQPLAGKTILLIAEQGLGDTLQFCRYATLAAEQGARVLLEVQEPLQEIMRSVSGVAEVLATGDPHPRFDLVSPLLGLPLALKTTLATIPGRTPYLRADENKVREWQARMGPKDKLRVGLVWSGGFRPNQPETWAVNARRNIPLRMMQPLRHPAIEFYSLQKGEPGESEWAELRSQSWDGPDLIDWTSELQDFSDTAALVENLDLVISADTSTAHLAGALGKPVWILHRFDSCWRWLLDRSDSPWYPTARLYRQSAPGGWEAVVQQVREDLFSMAG